MSDPRDDDPVRHETTVISTGERRGGGGAIVAIVVVLILGLAAFLFFGGYMRRVADKTDVNVNVSAPNIQLPDVQITPPATEPTNKTN
jgi:hypothetical protein